MNRQSSQSGMALLLPLLVFISICLIGLGALTQRNQQTSMQMHRHLLHQQLRWQAISAQERAIALLQTQPNTAPESIEFTERIAPVFAEYDPLEDERDPYGDITMEVRAHCEIQPASAEIVRALRDLMGETTPVEHTFVLTANASVAYRGGELNRRVVRLYHRLPSGEWRLAATLATLLDET